MPGDLADAPSLSVMHSGVCSGIAQVRIHDATPGNTLVLVDGEAGRSAYVGFRLRY